ncbi:PLP-dependent aminotransferase family protein [Alcaligenaceae bacterium CGII-47]|nr:PLP-dependent aminotransferase family protein [Alcaligenaceae bacterium CGII-47]
MPTESTLHQWASPLQSGAGTKYAAVVDAIEHAIQAGILKPGAKLPAQREIAESFCVTIATITKAISVAVRRGLVTTCAGSGTFVADAPDASLSIPTAVTTADIIDLSLNSPPPFITTQLLADNLRELTNSPKADALFDYAPIPGSQPNRYAAASWFALRGHMIDPESILIIRGAHEGLLVSLLALTKPGDAVLCESLNYTGLRRIGQMLGLKFIGIEADQDGMNADAVSTLVKQHAIKAIICTPITQNPTTATLSDTRRIQLVQAARSARVPIIEDDIYGPFVGNDIPPLATLWPEGVITISSLSKTVAPGLCVGYIVAPATLLASIRDAMFMLTWKEPSLQAAIASFLITTGNAEKCVLLHRNEAQARMQLASSILGKSMITRENIPSYHVWVSTGSLRADAIAAELYRYGILVSPASHFSMIDQKPSSALRISLGGASTHALLETALQAIARALMVNRTAAVSSIV